MDTMPGLEPVPTHRVTEGVPAGPPATAPSPAWVAPVMAGFEALAKRGGNWVPGVVAGILAAVVTILVHGEVGDMNLERVLKRQEARIEDLEDAQRQLIELHRHEQALAAWRDDSMEALAGKLGVKLTQRPQRSNLPVVQRRR